MAMSSTHVFVILLNFAIPAVALQRGQTFYPIGIEVSDRPLTYLGGNPWDLGVCEGDCDNDGNCPGDSVCIQRSGGSPAVVEGCTPGDSTDSSHADSDYCTNPSTPAGVLTNWGKNACTSSMPCGVCKGDCDSDSDCTAGLKCFQRDGHEAVQGCAGGGAGDQSDYDFCVALVPGALNSVGKDTCTSSNTCAECVGDCDSDSDCGRGLECFQRDSGEAVPGCPAGGDGDLVDYDYCVVAPTPAPGVLTNFGSDACTFNLPCSTCQGDCDTDSDCTSGLKCFQRDGHEAVQGCAGGGAGDVNDYDYCVALVPGALNNVGVDTCTSSNKCGECVGDCDSDSDCAEGLYCFKRDSAEAVPGCPAGGDGDLVDYDYCVVTPTPAPAVPWNSGGEAPSSCYNGTVCTDFGLNNDCCGNGLLTMTCAEGYEPEITGNCGLLGGVLTEKFTCKLKVYDDSMCDGRALLDPLFPCCVGSSADVQCKYGYETVEIGACGLLGDKVKFTCKTPYPLDDSKCHSGLSDSCCGIIGSSASCKEGYEVVATGSCGGGFAADVSRFSCRAVCSAPTTPAPATPLPPPAEAPASCYNATLCTDFGINNDCCGNGLLTMTCAEGYEPEVTGECGILGGLVTEKFTCKLKVYDDSMCDGATLIDPLNPCCVGRSSGREMQIWL